MLRPRAARSGLVGRDLQRWQPDEDDEHDLQNFSLEDDSSGWDQFAVNKEKFGVETTFKEELYTTRCAGHRRHAGQVLQVACVNL